MSENLSPTNPEDPDDPRLSEGATVHGDDGSEKPDTSGEGEQLQEPEGPEPEADEE